MSCGTRTIGLMAKWDDGEYDKEIHRLVAPGLPAGCSAGLGGH